MRIRRNNEVMANLLVGLAKEYLLFEIGRVPKKIDVSDKRRLIERAARYLKHGTGRPPTYRSIETAIYVSRW